MHFGVAALKLDRDRCLSQIGTHWKVRDRGDQCYGSCDIVENAMRTRLGEGQTDYGECWDEHNSRNGLFIPAVRDAIRTFDAGKEMTCQRTKYQLEPWLVMAMSETAPLTTWLPLTGMALLTMMKVFGAQVLFCFKMIFCWYRRYGWSGRWVQLRGRWVEGGEECTGRFAVVSQYICIQRACRMMTASVVWLFFFCCPFFRVFPLASSVDHMTRCRKKND